MILSALKRSAMVCLALTLALPLVAQQAQPIAGGNPALPLVHVENGENSAATQKAHYVVLVSLDGFRWDYAKHDQRCEPAGAGEEGCVGSGRDDAELSVADVSRITSRS